MTFLFLTEKKKKEIWDRKDEITCLESWCDSVVEAELELEADSQRLPIPNGDISFLIKSNVGQLSHHEFSNRSGLSSLSVFTINLLKYVNMD